MSEHRSWERSGGPRGAAVAPPVFVGDQEQDWEDHTTLQARASGFFVASDHQSGSHHTHLTSALFSLNPEHWFWTQMSAKSCINSSIIMVVGTDKEDQWGLRHWPLAEPCPLIQVCLGQTHRGQRLTPKAEFWGL